MRPSFAGRNVKQPQVVARIERSEIRENLDISIPHPAFTSFKPGYEEK
jgi:hypothetical protein